MLSINDGSSEERSADVTAVVPERSHSAFDTFEGRADTCTAQKDRREPGEPADEGEKAERGGPQQPQDANGRAQGEPSDRADAKHQGGQR